MRIVVTGARGQLGSAVTSRAPSDWVVVGVDRAELDLTGRSAVREIVALRPDVVVNCAAYTDVDGAESDAAACWALNADWPARLTGTLAGSGIRLVHISTDYVFDGAAAQPYPEDHPVSGLGEYGRSKAAGEQAIRRSGADAVVLRTAWLYGPSGRNFVRTILAAARRGDRLRVVDDQVGQPTYAPDLAERIVEVVGRAVPAGTYHATNAGSATWFEFARQIVAVWGVDAAIEPTDSSAFPRPAPRPAYSVLGHSGWAETGLVPMRHWRAALAAAHREHGDDFLEATP
jgi:dTDP-4-dehydrorhamnose reductase